MKQEQEEKVFDKTSYLMGFLDGGIAEREELRGKIKKIIPSLSLVGKKYIEINEVLALVEQEGEEK